MRSITRCGTLTGLILLFAAALAFAASAKTETQQTKPVATTTTSAATIHLIEIDAPITPVVSEYIIRSIDRAAKEHAEALIIQLNTPGGLLESTNHIVIRMLAAEVPIVVYVAPSGGRAASAGVFITMAANIAAMAPTTHIGAASPIQLEGKMDETRERKAMNDTAAMARSIAEKRGRNAEWAEDAVRKAVSLTETEALKL
ncbi:MAG TPA: ATP-dependent Clp protease proteolytic subunit, partial [Nitrospirota bacterium]